MSNQQPEQTLSYRLSLLTYTKKEELWFTSFANNFQQVRQGYDIMQLQDYPREPAFVIGAGPSMEKFGLMDKLSKASGRIFCADRMLKPLLEKGMEPDVCVTADGDPMVADFYPDSDYRTKVVLGNQAHPDVLKKLRTPPYWFIPMCDNPKMPNISVTRAIHWMIRKTMLPPYGNAGGYAFAIANHLGCSPIILMGIDCSYGEEKNPMRTLYWKGFEEEHKKVGKGIKDVIKECYRFARSGGRYMVLTDIVFDGYRASLNKGIELTKAEVWNVSPYSIVGINRVEHDGKWVDASLPNVEHITIEEALKRLRK